MPQTAGKRIKSDLKDEHRKIKQRHDMIKNRQEMIFTEQDQIQSTLYGESRLCSHHQP